MATTPTLETVIAAIKTAIEGVASVGTVVDGFHTREDDVEYIKANGYISSGSMNLWFIDLANTEELEGPSTGEFYSVFTIEIRYWSIRTGNADWSKEARQKAEAVRDALVGNSDVFAIGGQYQLFTPESVSIGQHGQTQISDPAGGGQMLYQTTLSLDVEARRWS